MSIDAATEPDRGSVAEPSEQAQPAERRFMLRGIELNWLVPLLAAQARGHASAGLGFLGLALVLGILSRVEVTLGTDADGPYYSMTRFWQSRRRAARTSMPGATLTHWSSILFCWGFELRSATSTLHVRTKGNEIPKPIAGLRATRGAAPSFSPNGKPLLYQLPNVVVLAWSMVVVRDVVCWQAVAVPLLGVIGIAFSLGACLVGVPSVRRVGRKSPD